MEDEGKTHQSLSNDEIQKTKTSNLKLDLELIQKSEENFLEEEESLKYDTTYKPVLVDYKKSSTLSTAVSQTENGFEVFQKKPNIKESMDDYIFYSRDRFNSTPITNYYEGTDNYFKGLNPEKNNYQKSNNYLEKKKYLREHFPSVDLMRYNNEDKIDNKIPQKLSVDINLGNPIPIQPPLTPQAQTTTLSLQNNLNKNVGKFNYPMYYYGYYSVDCKSNNLIINIKFLFINSI